MARVAEHYSRAMWTSLAGLLLNAALAVVKLVAGLVGNSYALVADAIESMSDIFASFIVWKGLSVAARPPDREHPYGHGKAEPLASLLVSLMLFAAGIGIAVEAIREIVTPRHAPAAFTLWVLLAVVLIKELAFRFMQRRAAQIGSDAVLVDAWHHRSDAITSLAAAIGISIALIGGRGYEPADDWAALFAACVIFYNAQMLIRAPLHELLDAEPVEVIEQVRRIAAGVPGVLGVEKVFARKSGMYYWVDMHLEVEPDSTVRHAHGVAHAVKDAIRAAIANVADVLIHIEPFGDEAIRGRDAT